MILGALHGFVHAGAAGDRAAFIAALSMQPKQLRIADVEARRQLIYQESLLIKGAKVAILQWQSHQSGIHLRIGRMNNKLQEVINNMGEVMDHQIEEGGVGKTTATVKYSKSDWHSPERKSS